MYSQSFTFLTFNKGYYTNCIPLKRKMCGLSQLVFMLHSSSWSGSKILNLKTGVRTTYGVPHTPKQRYDGMVPP